MARGLVPSDRETVSAFLRARRCLMLRLLEPVSDVTASRHDAACHPLP